MNTIMAQQIQVPRNFRTEYILPTVITAGVLYLTGRLRFIDGLFEGIGVVDGRIQIFPNIEIVLDAMLLVAVLVWFGVYTGMRVVKQKAARKGISL